MIAAKAALRITGFPGRYVQGPGAVDSLPTLVRELGARGVVVVSDDIVDAAIGPRIAAAMQAAGVAAERLRFAGECTRPAISKLAARARTMSCDVIAGLGGGKTIDTAKGVAKATGARLIIVPTIASNDSATSRLIVVYDESHRVLAVDFLDRNPDVVLVDTTVIARAPVRFFRAGIGDALSKCFEAAQCARAGGTNFFGGAPPELAGLMAAHCYRVIRQRGAAAVRSIERQRTSPAVESVVEATVLLSGLGFESGGLSIAHAMVRGLTGVPALAGALHGELVAFGTVVQMVLEGRDAAQLRRHLELLSNLGIRATLAGLGKEQLTKAELDRMARLTLAAPYIRNFDRAVDVAALKRATREADRLGRSVSG